MASSVSPASDPQRRALQTEQHVLAGDRRSLAGDGCRHERVAVAIAADPRADPHERPHDRCAAARGWSLQGVVDATVDVRNGRVEGLVEHRHDRAHLVDGRRLLGPQRRGAPERVDLLEQAAIGATLVGAVAQHPVALLEEARQAPDAR